MSEQQGRPSSYTEDMADYLCEEIACGKSLLALTKQPGMPHYSTVMRWLAAHESFRDKYARARSASADTDADKIGDITHRVLEGELDPNAARVAIDGLKWCAGRRAPAKYGDRMTTTHEGGEKPIEVEIGSGAARTVAREIAFVLAKALQAET